MTKKKEPKPDGVTVKDEMEDLTLVEVMKGVTTATTGDYTAEDRMRAVTAYLATGDSGKASKICGIPSSTIRDWKNKSHWWPDVYAKACAYYDQELDAKMTALIHDAHNAIEDRLQDGDYQVLRDGTLVRKPISGKDALMIAAVLIDKRAIRRGEPTSRSERVSKGEMVDELMNRFKQAAKEVKDASQVGGTIEIIKDDDD